MALLGTIVNAVFIIIGSLIGKFLSNIPEINEVHSIKGNWFVNRDSRCTNGHSTNNFLIVIISIVIGVVVGELIDLDGKLNQAGNWLESKIGKRGKGNISQGFIAGTLIFVVGAMAVVGALDSGIRGDHQVLYTKAMIDGFTAIILTSTLGIGVIFSSISVFLYQGIIALFASRISSWLPTELLDLMI